jgi:hypothetical protein
MPQIIVTAGDAADLDKAITLRERINATDFESDRFMTNLIERIAWAVTDAAEVEQRGAARELENDEPDELDEPDRAQAPRELVEV